MSEAELELSPPEEPVQKAPRRKTSVTVQAAQAVSAPLPQLSESDAMLALIERAARDATLDLDRMERIFKMREDMLNRQALVAFNAAMAKAQSEAAPVVRNRKNDHTRSKYADLAAIADAALPIVHANGFGMSFSEVKSAEPNCIGVACEVTHAGGHCKRYEFIVPLDKAGSQGKVNKTDTQAYGSTFTYGRRYATCAIFNIATADDDGNSRKVPQPESAVPDANEPISETDLTALREAMDAAGVDIPAFCAYFKLEKLGDITNANLPRAYAAVNKKAAGK